MPALTPQRALTWPGPLTSGVARMVVPSRSSTGLSAATTSPLNQPLIAWPIRPGMSHGATHVDPLFGDPAAGGDVDGVGTADGPNWIADVGDGVVAACAVVGSGAADQRCSPNRQVGKHGDSTEEQQSDGRRNPTTDATVDDHDPTIDWRIATSTGESAASA